MINFSEFFSVAFHATISVQYPTIGENEIMKFDRVTLNTGNG